MPESVNSIVNTDDKNEEINYDTDDIDEVWVPIVDWILEMNINFKYISAGNN